MSFGVTGAVIEDKYYKASRELFEYFSKGNSFTEETAVGLDINKVTDPARFNKFIKNVPLTNKWYLDREAYSKYLKYRKMSQFLFLLIGFCVAALFVWAIISVRKI